GRSGVSPTAARFSRRRSPQALRLEQRVSLSAVGRPRCYRSGVASRAIVDPRGVPLLIRMRKAWLIPLLLALGCASKQRPVATPPAPTPVIRSQTPPPNAELIEHCVVTKEENANTVSCRCLPVTTKIDSKTGQMVVVCKKMPEEK